MNQSSTPTSGEVGVAIGVVVGGRVGGTVITGVAVHVCNTGGTVCVITGVGVGVKITGGSVGRVITGVGVEVGKTGGSGGSVTTGVGVGNTWAYDKGPINMKPIKIMYFFM